MRLAPIAFACATMTLSAPALAQDGAFNDPLFRRCISWMLDGYRGAMLEPLCLEEYGLPPPSLFLCARKIRRGFTSPDDREGCALIFEEQAKKARAGPLR